jgi:hypothetical protein
MSQPLFEKLANATLDETRETYSTRGTQYGDTWKEARFVLVEAVLKKCGITLDENQTRALVLAALSDVKYWRNIGGLKHDSLIDGIAYTAAFASEVKKL